MTEKDEKLCKEFDLFGFKLNAEFCNTLKRFCHQFHLDEQKIAEAWIAFKCSKGLMQMSHENLDKFDKEWLQKQLRCSKQDRLTSIVSTLDQSDEDEDLITMYSDSPNGIKSADKHQVMPEEKNVMRKHHVSRECNRTMPLSPSFSPIRQNGNSDTAISAVKTLSSHTIAREVLVNFGATEHVDWIGQGQGCTVVSYSACSSLQSQYKYMFQKLTDKAHVLNDEIEEISEFLQRRNNIEEFSHIALPSQNLIYISGRVACDSQGKLNSQSIVLVGSCQTSSGHQIPLDLSEIKHFAFFPGQLIAGEAINITGMKLLLKSLYPNVPLPLHRVQVKTEPDSTLRVIVASGPFSASDKLNYEPLSLLLQCVAQDQPDVCILIGPFVDSKNSVIENGKCKIYEGIFQDTLRLIADKTKGLNCKVVIVPSSRDIHHHPVYPQGPFILNDNIQHFYLASDPCTLDINNIVFGITSTDVLFHLGAEEIAQCTPGTIDRLGRLVQHLLDQHSYYPLFPPSEEVNADIENFSSSVKMHVTPHVLITPSELRYFIKECHGCCCINPGRLTKGQITGTFTRLIIHSKTTAESTTVVPTIAGQILRIKKKLDVCLRCE